MKVYISQPMRNKTDEEIQIERDKIIKLLQNKFDDPEILDQRSKDKESNKIKALAHSIEVLSQADFAFFGPKWNYYGGCKIEHIICEEYGIPFENSPDEPLE